MTNHDPQSTGPCRWLHYWAVVTVCATVVLLALGAVVTTFRVGMADPLWPTYPWHLLLISWEEPQPGFLIEHTHRLAGYVVGCCVIVLAIGAWRRAPRTVGWLGWAALAGVTTQGLIGGFRVKLHALIGSDLAFIHGCFAPVVFALLVSLAVMTGRGWMSIADMQVSNEQQGRVRRWALGTTVLVYLQIVFGAWIRHSGSPMGQRAHLLLAFGVVVMVALLAKAVYDGDPHEKRLTGPVKVLVALLVVQLMLGVEAWLMRSSSEWMLDLKPVTVGQAVIRTAHVLVGAWLLAASVIVTLQTHRRVVVTDNWGHEPIRHLEGVA